MRFLKNLRSHWLKTVLGILPFALYFKLTDTMSWRPQFIEWKAAYYDSMSSFNSATFLPDGTFVTVTEDSQIRLWNPSTGKLQQTHQIYEPFQEPGFNAQAWRYRPQPQPFSMSPPQGGGKQNFQNSPNLPILADPPVLQPTPQPTTAPDKMSISEIYKHPFAFSANGQIVANTTFREANIQLWDVRSGAPFQTIDDRRVAHNHRLLAISPQAKTVAIVRTRAFEKGQQIRSDELLLFSVATTKHLQTIRTGMEPMMMEFAPDGRSLWAAGSNLNPSSPYFGAGNKTYLKRWETTTGKQISSRQFVFRLNTMKLSPDGKALATNGLRGEVILWDCATGRELRVFKAIRPPAHGDIRMAEMADVAFSPDGQLLASAEGHQAQLWDVGSGKFLRSIIRPEIPQYSGNPNVDIVLFSPDSRNLALLGMGGRNAHLFRVQ